MFLKESFYLEWLYASIVLLNLTGLLEQSESLIENDDPSLNFFFGSLPSIKPSYIEWVGYKLLFEIFSGNIIKFSVYFIILSNTLGLVIFSVSLLSISIFLILASLNSLHCFIYST